jgi:N-acetylglucosaminyldiphosphoundecaprenol N-acetyl-beta-D-mannosaminyltransferase
MLIQVERRHLGAGTDPNPFGTFATVNLRGACLSALTEADCVQVILDELDAGRGGWVITMNLDHLRRFETDPVYASRTRRASLLIADGMPLVWASHLKGTPLPERITGSNLIWSLSRAAGERRRSVFLLGGSSYASPRTAQILHERFPQLHLTGVLSPPLGFEQDAAEVALVMHSILAAQPDIVYVALGSPKEEDLIDHLRAQLPHTWWIGVGISFSFVSGEIMRAPLWVQRAGFEWLHRLVQEPQRLAKRYLIQGIPYAVVLLHDALRHGIAKRIKR